MTKAYRSLFFLFLLALVVVPSCATTSLDTPEKVYMTALDEFTASITKYNAYYDMATAETKAEWKETIDPIIKDANHALDLWGLVLEGKSNDTPDAVKYRYLALKTELLKLLTERVFKE